ncbi:GntR family transcriptional regulator [Ureibacillus aquaedulcis]|uniref:GntR family transcriptional regulator n=1 Tax=Ureibacillus aquaedulcis TaxID=3058421 RepID=A0ABT8GVZ3_9BACL|nr:GntR family transcriptional regulator [Ureibacillus sp. BA0131]MDN4495583.1 GntR family transcriptional regulator [Ureibacillus sp. BA0131]
MCAQLERVQPLYEQYYALLKNRIMTNEYPPNARLIDTQLAKEFGTSRSPIREALRMLEQEGLLVNNKGILTVYEPTLIDLVELYKVRSGLEYSAVYWATEYQTEEFIVALDDCLEKTKEALNEKDYKTVIQLNTKFHDLILYASKNSRLIEMMEKIRSLILLYRNILFLDFDLDYNFLEDHERVSHFIKTKDSKKSAEVIVDHINNDIAYFKKVFNKKNRSE